METIATNTHLCGPEEHGPGIRFLPEDLRGEVESIIFQVLGDAPYDAISMREATDTIADRVTALCSSQGKTRYKFAVHATAFEKRGQAAALAARAFWGTEEDGLLSVTHETGSWSASVLVWATYFE